MLIKSTVTLRLKNTFQWSFSFDIQNTTGGNSLKTTLPCCSWNAPSFWVTRKTSCVCRRTGPCRLMGQTALSQVGHVTCTPWLRALVSFLCCGECYAFYLKFLHTNLSYLVQDMRVYYEIEISDFSLFIFNRSSDYCSSYCRNNSLYLMMGIKGSHYK